VLALQRVAGNRAVQSLVQRQSADAPTAQDASGADGSGSTGVGSLVEDYHIYFGEADQLERRVTPHDNPVGDVNWRTYTEDSVLHLTPTGLQNHLSQLAHGPLEPFEAGLVATWGKDPSDVITPLIRIGDKGIAGLVVESGGWGRRARTLYSRSGDVVLREGITEPGVVSEGLGPLDWVLVVGGVAALGRLALAKYAAKRAVAAEAAAIAASKEFVPEGQYVLAVIQDGKIIRTSYNTSLSHEVFVERELGWTKADLPAGAEVVSIGKYQGEIQTMLSSSFHNSGLPASAAAQEAARRAYR
jgi:hypothetical protein